MTDMPATSSPSGHTRILEPDLLHHQPRQTLIQLQAEIRWATSGRDHRSINRLTDMPQDSSNGFAFGNGRSRHPR